MTTGRINQVSSFFFFLSKKKKKIFSFLSLEMNPGLSESKTIDKKKKKHHYLTPLSKLLFDGRKRLVKNCVVSLL